MRVCVCVCVCVCACARVCVYVCVCVRYFPNPMACLDTETLAGGSLWWRNCPQNVGPLTQHNVQTPLTTSVFHTFHDKKRLTCFERQLLRALLVESALLSFDTFFSCKEPFSFRVSRSSCCCPTRWIAVRCAHTLIASSATFPHGSHLLRSSSFSPFRPFPHTISIRSKVSSCVP